MSIAVLDADVLFPMMLRDTLLRGSTGAGNAEPPEGSARGRSCCSDRGWHYHYIEHPRLRRSSARHRRHDAGRFLISLMNTDADRLLEALVAQAAGYRRPTLSVVELVEKLSGIAPKFAAKALSILSVTQKLMTAQRRIGENSGFTFHARPPTPWRDAVVVVDPF